MPDINLKTLTPDTTINDSAFVFGADSQAATDPSVYAVSTLRAHIVGAGSVNVASGKTLTTSNTLTLAGTDGTTMTFPSTTDTVVGLSATQTLTGKTLTDPVIVGTILEDVFTITDGAAFEIDPGNGSIQLITLGASRTPKATNFAAGESVLLMVDDGSAFTLTWTDATFGTGGVIWESGGGTAPTLSTSGYTSIVLWKVGTQIYGAQVGNA